MNSHLKAPPAKRQRCDGDIPDDSDGAPPTSDDESDDIAFEDTLAKRALCPARLRGLSKKFVQEINDDYFAMLNDQHRNQFFWNSLKALPVHGKRVLDLGAGTGLLSLMAARLGAAAVIAVDASHEMAEVVRESAKHNGVADIVQVIACPSTELDLPEEQRVDIIVSETFGVLLLQEDFLASIAHARHHLAKPGVQVVPAGGAQYVSLISSTSLRQLTGDASSLAGLCCGDAVFDMAHVGSLRQTAKLSFSMPGGFCLNTLPDVVHMTDRVCLFKVDSHMSECADLPTEQTFKVVAKQDGQIDAAATSWEAWSGSDGLLHSMSTHAEDTRGQPWGFARDAHWGQGLQIVEDADLADSAHAGPPAPLLVKAGETLLLTVRFQMPSRRVFQVILRRSDRVATQQEQDEKEQQGAPTAAAAEKVLAASMQCVNCGVRPETDAFDMPALCDAPDLDVSDSGGSAKPQVLFPQSLPGGYWCPPRLQSAALGLVEAINDDYFALLSDAGRTDFFHAALENLPVAGRRVLDLGAGAGILGLIAARLGAASVLCVEASSAMAELARKGCERNGLSSSVQVEHALSSRLSVPEEEQRADVIICEPYDVFLTGQGGSTSLDYLVDARENLAKPGARVIPSGGGQFVMLVSSPLLGARDTVSFCEGQSVDLANLGVFLDTATVAPTRTRGFRLSALPDLLPMSERAELFTLDFQTACRQDVPLKRTVSLRALRAGRVDAVVTSWEVWAGAEQSERASASADSEPPREAVPPRQPGRPTLATHADVTRESPWGLARDIAFGQGVQLLEDAGSTSSRKRGAAPAPMDVAEGEEVLLTAHITKARDAIQFTLQRASDAAAAAPTRRRVRGRGGRGRV